MAQSKSLIPQPTGRKPFAASSPQARRKSEWILDESEAMGGALETDTDPAAAAAAATDRKKGGDPSAGGAAAAFASAGASAKAKPLPMDTYGTDSLAAPQAQSVTNTSMKLEEHLSQLHAVPADPTSLDPSSQLTAEMIMKAVKHNPALSASLASHLGVPDRQLARYAAVADGGREDGGGMVLEDETLEKEGQVMGAGLAAWGLGEPPKIPVLGSDGPTRNGGLQQQTPVRSDDPQSCTCVGCLALRMSSLLSFLSPRISTCCNLLSLIDLCCPPSTPSFLFHHRRRRERACFCRRGREQLLPGFGTEAGGGGW